VLALNLVQTVALAGAVLFFGHWLRRVVPVLARLNLPAPVVGGLPVALVMSLARLSDTTLVTFDLTLRDPLMIAFFTSIGFGASVAMLRRGGPAVVLFFVFSTIAAIAQNVVGAGVAMMVGQNPLLGVLAGSVTLTGGPATGLAFAPYFEAAGVPGAATLAVAAAMVGIVSGGLLGGPLGTWLVEKNRLASPDGAVPSVPLVAQNVVESQVPDPVLAVPAGQDVESYGLLKSLVLILVAMGLGTWASQWLESIGVKPLPAYIGAMMIAAILRNLDDVTGIFGISQRTIDDLGDAALSVFLALALMTLTLWELKGLALPLFVIVAAQVALVAVICLWPAFRLMGGDYEAAVMSSGFCGFMLGTTANAMANMKAIVERYGAAPKAFLVVPMVGAFFIDFTNALIINACLYLFR
jgi:ESS family glutamate:Na+ symporter